MLTKGTSATFNPTEKSFMGEDCKHYKSWKVETTKKTCPQNCFPSVEALITLQECQTTQLSLLQCHTYQTKVSALSGITNIFLTIQKVIYETNSCKFMRF